MKNKKGFTLVELLAVIAILVILVLIALPNVIGMFNNAKKSSFLTEAKTIYKEIAKKYISESMKGNKITEIYSDDESKLDISTDNLDYCAILDTNGNVKKLIVANGSYYIQLDSIDDVNMIRQEDISEGVLDKLECSIRYDRAVDYIKKLYNDENSKKLNGLKSDNTKDRNIRYEGSNPNNYVRFNDELWRIIGVFGDNIKIVKNTDLGNMVWDHSKNSGFGINEWSQSDLKKYLNDVYYGGTDSSNALNSVAKSMIDNHLWNTGGINIEALENSDSNGFLNTVKFYEAERGNDYYKKDSVARTTTWNGYVALPYVTDWVYASSEERCEKYLDDGYDESSKNPSANMTCKKNNWMHFYKKYSFLMWTISPAVTDNNFYSIAIYNDGCIGEYFTSSNISIFPSVYLKSSVRIISGDGTISNPYELKYQ